VALDPTVQQFLEDVRFGTLATINRSGSPQQTVMWYELQGDEIMMNTARGRLKDRNLVADNRASLCVDDGYHYVTITGRITMNDDQTVAQADIHRLAVRYDGKERADEMSRDQFGKQERITLRLSIDRVSAHGF
jgi:PPOX class probable F420-dependent enzyme